jgi:hypothetical protein
MLLGLPVMVTPAMQIGETRHIGLVAPSVIFWADEGVVQLSASVEAAIEQTDARANNSLESSAAQMVSMYQTDSIALRGNRQSNWYGKPGATAYFSTDY